jgi:hypothetical protein
VISEQLSVISGQLKNKSQILGYGIEAPAFAGAASRRQAFRLPVKVT